MRATFFLATRQDAAGVNSSAALPDDGVGESLELQGLGAVRTLAAIAGCVADDAFHQVVDTTCQSFPVWQLSGALCRALREADDGHLDRIAEKWHATVDRGAMDADLYELSTLLADLRDALAAVVGDEAQLFVLLEETAG